MPGVAADGEAVIRISFEEKCDNCGLCARYCPFGALTRGCSGAAAPGGEGKTPHPTTGTAPRKEKPTGVTPSEAVCGYAGKILRVDLTNERITEEVLDEATLRKWVGGIGLGAKYLYEEVPPGTRWNDPENRLIVASGPLGGTMVGGSATISFSTKGVLTDGATSTQANGFMGAFMKTSGCDAVIFEGIARRWLYLYIHDGTAELRDASHLIGKNTWETEDAIKAELGYAEQRMSVFCIGPAGENLVKFAGIFGDKDHAAGHNGIGAVMGVKKLKAFCAPLGTDAHQGGIAEASCCRPSNRYGTISRATTEAGESLTMGTGGTLPDRRGARGGGNAARQELPDEPLPGGPPHDLPVRPRALAGRAEAVLGLRIPSLPHGHHHRRSVPRAEGGGAGVRDVRRHGTAHRQHRPGGNAGAVQPDDAPGAGGERIRLSYLHADRTLRKGRPDQG